MAAKKAAKTEEIDIKERVYAKDQILMSERYAHQKDLVGSLLKDEKKYSLSKVDTLIKEFLEGKVN